jgi:hypothetical protein
MGLTDLTDLLDMPNLSPENMRIAAEIVQMFTQGNRQQQESIQQDRYRQQALDAQRTEGAADRQNRLDLAQIQADAASGRDQFDPRVAEATRQATLERAQQAITVIQAMGAEDLVHKLPTFLEALKADPETFHQVRAFLQSPAFLDQARGAISPSLHDLSRVQNDVVAGEPEIVTDSNGHRMVRPGSYRSGPTTSVWTQSCLGPGVCERGITATTSPSSTRTWPTSARAQRPRPRPRPGRATSRRSSAGRA